MFDIDDDTEVYAYASPFQGDALLDEVYEIRFIRCGSATGTT
jgi:hypothetical protein